METKSNTGFQKGKGYIFVAYHKPFKIIQGDFIIPIHAGQDYQKEDFGFGRIFRYMTLNMLDFFNIEDNLF